MSYQAPSDASSATQISNPRQTPLDWSNFISFQTSSSPSNTSMQNGHNGNSGNHNAGGGEGNQGDQSHADSYRAFAQGIAMSRPSPSAINFAQPQYRSNSNTQTRPPRQPSSPRAQPPPQQSSQQMSYPPPPQPRTDEPSRSSSQSSGSGKGKSPATNNQNMVNDPSNGLSLDSSAFSRDIRFQVPQFLSNNIGGAPTFPPGGEAWSGFSPANLFDTSGTHQLTPGSLFGTNFGANPPDGYNDGGNGGRNVLEGLSGFMGDNSWENWGETKGSPNNFGTTFYVNPNPSPSVLAPKHEPQQHPDAAPPRQNAPPAITINSGSVGQQPHNDGSRNDAARASTSLMSPLNDNTTGTMPTSAIFSQQESINPGSYDIPSISTPVARNIANIAATNFASSSSQPYVPPSNSQALLQGPSLPPNMLGTSLTDGPGLYSTTGFDMVGILSKIANRKDPKTQLGPVDFSCSFVVVDIRRYDAPIVYSSPTFTALTGYDQSQIVGRNCRFLQSPDGDVPKGSKRKYTDNVAVAHFKRMLNAGKECQASLINYRRGGMPFINLVTVIPIPWETNEIVYHVGFQVDLVEQPNAILRNMRDGSYQVNYMVTNIPQPPMRIPPRDLGDVGLSQEVLDIMGAKVNQPGFAQGEDGGKMEWLKMILENADGELPLTRRRHQKLTSHADFVHVLSLKGMFQYVSPSVRRVLEYEPEDLINKNMSDICHPSDIVPLMRELKDSTHAPVDGNSARTVNLVFRIRRKSSGYVWIECAGRLHVEPGKGRKAVILAGRARSVPSLPWEIVSHHGGLADPRILDQNFLRRLDPPFNFYSQRCLGKESERPRRSQPVHTRSRRSRARPGSHGPAFVHWCLGIGITAGYQKPFSLWQC